MAYLDLRDFMMEAAFNFFDDDLYIEIEALGGGTIGESYDRNYWRYIVYIVNWEDKNPLVTRQEISRGQDFWSGSPMTHQDAAMAIRDYFVNKRELIDFDELELGD